jgi:hypothetical protein
MFPDEDITMEPRERFSELEGEKSGEIEETLESS